MSEHRIESAELSVEEIMAATEGALAHARERYGEQVDAKTIDLRLWAAAALIDSALRASVKPAIMRSLEEKLATMRASRRVSGT